MRALPPGTVACIHFCDAPAGVALAEYQDWEREFAGDGVSIWTRVHDTWWK